MKKAWVALLLLACLPLLPAQEAETRFGQEPPTAKPGVDYLVKVHVSGIRVHRYCDRDGCNSVLFADAVLNQQKVELTGGIIYGARAFYDPRNSQRRLAPGDYTARLRKAAHKDGPHSLYDEYELLMPDRTVWRCTVTGIFE
ncbi:conserved exported hypothetical protein [Candidatus Sulfotelmatomonas gaucii]|uniref:DUF2141 domain-containing protein n=1 Tax=Candidatus Sulfuritelmatomonas gaucii TaxID=2043161 RepID=A0A2N9L6Q0_9BACT|nr:conserved exported hypothetical protein [Candidatus Sulfotelmatomonas gaucii]